MFNAKLTGQQISLYRRKRKYTQEALAERLGISTQAVSKGENGYAMPEVAMLAALAEMLDCSVDAIINPSISNWENVDFDYSFTLFPQQPINDYTGVEWPKSIALASLFTALKLFLGLEERKDYQGRQLNDDTEYILQAALTNVCFGYSWRPEQLASDCLAIYGLKYDVLHSSECTPE